MEQQWESEWRNRNEEVVYLLYYNTIPNHDENVPIILFVF